MAFFCFAAVIGRNKAKEVSIPFPPAKAFFNEALAQAMVFLA